eukprot:Hpha_TRINITY_DN16033_c0_g11::TRINITY_DN16033_c0_g11_i2::g.121704::m.121704
MPASSSSSSSSASARPQERAPQRSYADAVAGGASLCVAASPMPAASLRSGPQNAPAVPTAQEDACVAAAALPVEEKLLCPQDSQCLYLSDPVHHSTHRHSCPRKRCPLRGLGQHSTFFLHPEDDGVSPASSRKRRSSGLRERGGEEDGQPTRGRLVAYDFLDCACCVFSANTARLSVGRTKRILAEALGLGMEGDVSSVELFDSNGRNLMERGRMLEQFGVLPGAILYVDDAARRGVLLARRRRAAARLFILISNRVSGPATRHPHPQPHPQPHHRAPPPKIVAARGGDPSPPAPRGGGGGVAGGSSNPQQRENGSGPRARTAAPSRHPATVVAGNEACGRAWIKLGALLPVIVSWITDVPPGHSDASLSPGIPSPAPSTESGERTKSEVVS